MTNWTQTLTDALADRDVDVVGTGATVYIARPGDHGHPLVHTSNYPSAAYPATDLVDETGEVVAEIGPSAPLTEHLEWIVNHVIKMGA